MTKTEYTIMCGGLHFYANPSIKEGDLPNPVVCIKNWQALTAGWKCVKHPWLDPSAKVIVSIGGKRLWSCKPVWLCPECYEWHQGKLGDWNSENKVLA